MGTQQPASGASPLQKGGVSIAVAKRRFQRLPRMSPPTRIKTRHIRSSCGRRKSIAERLAAAAKANSAITISRDGFHFLEHRFSQRALFVPLFLLNGGI